MNPTDAPDECVRGVAHGGEVKVVAARTTATIAELIRRHDAGPIGAMAIARVGTAAALLAAGLKDRQQVAVQVNGDGPVGEVYAIADVSGRLRLAIHGPHAEAPDGKLKLGPAIGRGRLSIVRKLAEDEPPYRGVVELVDGEIGSDVAEALMVSEQVHSAVGVGEKLGPEGLIAAGGFLIQALPGASEATLKSIEARVGVLPPLGELLAEGQTPVEILEWLVDDLTVLARTHVHHECPCSREQFARYLIGLGVAEIESLIETNEITEVSCHFCGDHYQFDREQMRALRYGAQHMN
ncbi:MAG: Hsp33 family molecular chaperone HslO [Myxococcales bacterium]|nr:Hsp33 family molecular chaperone HslO [Myxococcales bacterium]